MGNPKGNVPWSAGTSQGWTDKRGYRWRYITVNGKKRAIREHRYVMREHLGRELEPWEVVHHKDGNPLNNDLGNLELVEVGEHTYHHHNGSQRDDNAKKSLRIYTQMLEEIKHLRGLNAALLEALEDALDTLDEVGVFAVGKIKDVIDDSRRKARAAIAQAKGA